MRHEAGIWDIAEAEAAADARAEADVRAGRVVPHQRVASWLKDLAEGRRTPRPRRDD
ncbi:MAG: antitoxin [Sphingomicrobium sp.]|nr:antitoxin [Sphingomonadales bacterium]